jgi:Fungal specific transcription factor domain
VCSCVLTFSRFCDCVNNPCLVGLAALVGQDLGLHSDSASAVSKGRENGKRSVEELAIRRRVWGVTFILDLFLSLQLSRPSAIVDALFFFDCPTAPTSSSWLSCTSRINSTLYLGFSRHHTENTAEHSLEILTRPKNELDIWHQSLPMQFGISIGHQPMRGVIWITPPH